MMVVVFLVEVFLVTMIVFGGWARNKWPILGEGECVNRWSRLRLENSGVCVPERASARRRYLVNTGIAYLLV